MKGGYLVLRQITSRQAEAIQSLQMENQSDFSAEFKVSTGDDVEQLSTPANLMGRGPGEILRLAEEDEKSFRSDAPYDATLTWEENILIRHFPTLMSIVT